MNSSKNRTGMIIGIIVIILILGVVSWYVYAKSSAAKSMNATQAMATSTMNMTNGGMPGTGGGAGGRAAGMRGGFVSGSIEVLNDTGFTVTLSDGTTKDVTLTATTTLQNYTSATAAPTTITADDLSVGEQVSVIGTPNVDGSIDARMVRTGAVPARGTGQGGGGHRGTASVTPAAPAQ